MADAAKPAAPPAAAPAAGAPAAGAPPPAPPAGGAAAAANAAAGKEPAFQLKIEPSDFIVFKSDKFPPDEGSAAEVKLTNNTKSLQCYKVKCTSNEIFRVRPPLGYVKQDQTMSIKFSLIAKSLPDASKHFFAFYHVGVEDDSKTARQVWSPTAKPDGVLRVPVKFLKADGSPWPPAAAAGAPPPAAGAPPAAAAAPAPAANGAKPAAPAPAAAPAK